MREITIKTIVYQSYRTQNVPEWINKCMNTVREWSEINSFEYKFIDDRFFDYVPKWYYEKSDKNILLTADLARLEVAKELLNDGYERTIWIDADILIYNIHKFSINITDGFALTKEIWLGKKPRIEYIPFKIPFENYFEKKLGAITFYEENVCNAMSVYTNNTAFLDFYIEACKTIVKNKEKPVSAYSVGTPFLTLLHRHMRFPLIENIGLFSPYLLQEIAFRPKDNNLIKNYRKRMGENVFAANLCGYYRNRKVEGHIMTDDLFLIIVNKLIESQGNIINQF